MGKTITLGFNDFRQVFISLQQGLEGFCNQYLATKTMNSVLTIRGLLKNFRQSYYEPLAWLMI